MKKYVLWLMDNDIKCCYASIKSLNEFLPNAAFPDLVRKTVSKLEKKIIGIEKNRELFLKAVSKKKP